MAKKTTKKSGKKVSRKASRSRAAARKPGKKKAPARKPAAKKTTRKKTTAKKKSAAKKKLTKKKVTKKKITKKKITKKKITKKKVTKKAVTKKAVTKKAVTKKAVTEKAVTEKAVTKKAVTKKKKKKGRGRSLGARSVAEAASAGTADSQGYVYINGRRVRMMSTGGQVFAKPKRTPKSKIIEAVPEVNAKPTKTKLTAAELRRYRDLLLQKRSELVGDVSAMEKAALQSRGGNLSTLPIHMADIGTDTYDQDFMLSLAETERGRLREIDDALRRVQDKTYGVCQMTGKPIPTARLKAKPWAKYTIESARKVEGQWPA